MLSVISQTEKDKYCTVSLTCGSGRKTNPQKQNRVAVVGDRDEGRASG